MKKLIDKVTHGQVAQTNSALNLRDMAESQYPAWVIFSFFLFLVLHHRTLFNVIIKRFY